MRLLSVTQAIWKGSGIRRFAIFPCLLPQNAKRAIGKNTKPIARRRNGLNCNPLMTLKCDSRITFHGQNCLQNLDPTASLSTPEPRENAASIPDYTGVFKVRFFVSFSFSRFFLNSVWHTFDFIFFLSFRFKSNKEKWQHQWSTIGNAPSNLLPLVNSDGDW